MLPVNTYTLPNGLKILHHRDTNTAMVTVSILYKVGARDESDNHRGLAHLFEHLMFGGSKNIPDFDGALQRAGGVSNAFTSDDVTYFYDLIPAHNAETAFWLESDRMNQLAFTQKSLETQRSVVVEEFKQVCLNQPYGDLYHNLKRTAYHVHPYRVPVIGEKPEDIMNVDMDTVRNFFYSHYSPSNAILTVTGNISFEKTIELATRWFATIEPRKTAPAIYPQEPKQISHRHIEVNGEVPNTVIVKAYHMDGFGQEYVAADILSDILGNGKSSRLIRKGVMEGELMLGADASISGTIDPGLFMLTATLRPGASVTETEKELTKIAHSVIDMIPTAMELDRAVNQYEARLKFKNLSYDSLARSLALNESVGTDFDRLLEMYHNLTPESIATTARKIFDENNSTTLIYSPR
ncbi:MAG: insulinase family protein [Muribaculum sp.]|nr:insulinase family protein [Muribaculum sp.]